MQPKSHRGINIKTETLLKFLARDSKSEKVKLRACELLLMLEGRLAQHKQIKPPKEPEIAALAILVNTQDVEPKEFCKEEIDTLQVEDYSAIQELVSAAR